MGTQSGRPLDLSGTQLGQQLSRQFAGGGPPGSKGTAAMPPPPQMMQADPRMRANPEQQQRLAEFQARERPGQANRQGDFRQHPAQPDNDQGQSPAIRSIADALRYRRF